MKMVLLEFKVMLEQNIENWEKQYEKEKDRDRKSQEDYSNYEKGFAFGSKIAFENILNIFNEFVMPQIENDSEPNKNITCADCARADNDDFCKTRDENDSPYEYGELCSGFIALDDEESIKKYLS